VQGLLNPNFLTVVACGKAVALQETFGMKVLADYSVINAKTPKRLEDIEAAITFEIRKASGSGASNPRSTSKEFQRVFDRGSKTLRQFGSENVIEIGFSQIPVDLPIKVGDKYLRPENLQH